MATARHRLIAAGLEAVAATRADRLLAPLARGCGLILTLHHVRPWQPRPFAPNRLLEITPDFLDRVIGLLRSAGFALISLDEIPDRLRRPGPPFAAITFDDGYRDNLEHALPVLRRHGVPWTLFATTEFASGQGRLWWIELEAAIAALDQIEVDLDGSHRFPATTAAEKHAAFQAIYARLRAGPEPVLRETIAALAAYAGVNAAALVADLCLTWDELALLAREPGVTIGAHTVSHPMLAKHPMAAVRRELGDSKAEIERRLGIGVRHLAYPVGDRTSAGAREFQLARELGFTTGLTTRPGHLFPGHLRHLHALPRVSVNGLFQNERAIAALLSGVPFLLWNRGRRLDVA